MRSPRPPILAAAILALAAGCGTAVRAESPGGPRRDDDADGHDPTTAASGHRCWRRS